MKNIIITFFCFALFSCQNTTDNRGNSKVGSSKLGEAVTDSSIRPTAFEKSTFKDSVPYQTIRFYKTTPKSANPTDSGKYAYVKTIYPQFAKDQAYLNNKILSIASAEPWTGNRTYSMEKASQSFFKDYLEFKKDFPDSPIGYTWDENLNVSFQDNNLLVLTEESYVYTGGAHGLESILYYNLDLKSEKELTLDDLLIDNYNTKLTDVAESVFRTDENLTPTEPLENYFFENKIFRLNDNFAITPKGLLFTFNPYEIKSYAEGTTDLLIPYSKIKTLIKQNSFISKYINK